MAYSNHLGLTRLPRSPPVIAFIRSIRFAQAEPLCLDKFPVPCGGTNILHV